MMVVFTTNLDLARRYLPRTLGQMFDHVPQVGALVDIPIGAQKVMQLRVCSVRYRIDKHPMAPGEVSSVHVGSHNATAVVELHIPTDESIASWDARMKLHINGDPEVHGE